jgi:hypothetical protein
MRSHKCKRTCISKNLDNLHANMRGDQRRDKEVQLNINKIQIPDLTKNSR